MRGPEGGRWLQVFGLVVKAGADLGQGQCFGHVESGLDVGRGEDEAGEAHSGQRAEVFIETGHKTDALVVPQQFIQWREGKSGVFVDDEGKAAWREVTLGLRGRESVEVAEGLSVGETVVAPTDLKQPPLKPGQRVTAK